MMIKKSKLEKVEIISEKSLEKSELQPYDILPNIDNILIVQLLKAAKASGAAINDATIKTIEEHIL